MRIALAFGVRVTDDVRRGGMMVGASRYLVHEMLGEGAFGAVYRATLWRSHGLQVEVAMKVLRPSVSERMLHRFRDEARLLGLLQHDAIVRVYELAQVDGAWAVAMELVPGMDLARIVDTTGALPLPVVFTVGERVASALEHAWKHAPTGGTPLRLEHRDIKPANILLTRHGEVKVLDFGIARAVFSGREAHTGHMARFGTPPYMAPARWVGERDENADVFALGVTLMQLVVAQGAPLDATFTELRTWRTDLAERVRQVVDPETADVLEAMIVENTEERLDLTTVKRRLRLLATRPSEVHAASWAEDVVPRLLQQREQGDGPWSGRDLRATGPATLEISPTDRLAPLDRSLLADVEPTEEVARPAVLLPPPTPVLDSPTGEVDESVPLWVGVAVGSGVTLAAVGVVLGVVTVIAAAVLWLTS
ncbi:MAG: serine/threonine protein kinase [Myxococcota bacterium]